MPLKDNIELLALQIFFQLSKRLGVDRASGFAGAVLRRVGPHTRNHRRALDNLRIVLPALTPQEHEKILDGMWDNLGRLVAEYPHLDSLIHDPSRVRIEGLEQCRAAMEPGKGGFLLSAHYGNWEVSTACGHRLGLTQANFHLPMRNPKIEDLYRKQRQVTVTGPLIAKSKNSLREMARLLQQGVYIGMLVDHKLDDGLLVPFLGLPALTNHAPALLARRMNVPIFLGRVIREQKTTFKIECQPVTVDVSSDWQADVYSTTLRINGILGEWIAQRPEQWCWFHKRWKRKTMQRPYAADASNLPAQGAR
jgi:KDO2-lipid IV(A) lauroyltransferase